jgi:hypothetical protein
MWLYRISVPRNSCISKNVSDLYGGPSFSTAHNRSTVAQSVISQKRKKNLKRRKEDKRLNTSLRNVTRI